MDWLERMKDAVEYLEDHLEEALDMKQAAQAACASPFHFQRMFHVLTGVTVAEYVRKRRLTMAAQELAASQTRVLDTALKYGYETPESFTRAFRRLHGINPSAAREPGANLKAYPRISFHISLKGDKEMNYRIVEKGAYRVVGKGVRVTTKDGENFRRIPEFWTECCKEGTIDKIAALGDNGNTLGICMDIDPEEEALSYLIAVEKAAGAAPEGCMAREIPAATWAVFKSVGPMPEAIQKIWERIYAEWFPSTGYEHAGGPEIELYPPGNPAAPDYRCEVWIPISKK